MKKIFLFFFIFLFVFSMHSFADTLTLTTFYPAPFGMYQELRVMGKVGIGTTDPVEADRLVVAEPDIRSGILSSVYTMGSGGGDGIWAMLLGQGVQPASSGDDGALYIDVANGSYGIYQSNKNAKNFFEGKVGIGTTDPSAFADRFAVVEEDARSGILSSFYTVGAGGAGSWAMLLGQGVRPASSGDDGALYIDVANGSYGIYQDNTNAKNYFEGKVGIGATDPQTLLEIEGAAPVVRLNDTNGGSDWNVGASDTMNGQFFISEKDAGGTTTPHFQIKEGGNIGIGYSVMTQINNAKLAINGNVGIGTTNAVVPLTVQASGIYPIMAYQTDNSSNGSFGINVVQGVLPLSSMQKGGVSIQVADFNYGILQNNVNTKNYFGGKIGIGKSNPVRKLEVSGGLLVNNGRTVVSIALGAPGDSCDVTCAPCSCVIGMDTNLKTVEACNWATGNKMHCLCGNVPLSGGHEPVPIGEEMLN